jgi:2-hydroxychromene-2-carboxylate isomerase
MAAERIGGLLPDADWRPIFLAGLFDLNGRTSWIFSDEAGARMEEIKQRAAGYGLPPIRWPKALPRHLVDLGRAATVAKHDGQVVRFSLAAFRAIYVDGGDPSQPEELVRLASGCGLDPDRFLERIRSQEVTDELRHTTGEAHALGVPGVPTVVVDGQVFWGDDRLDEAAAHFRGG